MSAFSRLLLRWMALAAALSATAAHGQTGEPPPTLEWDCWVSTAQTIAIRCIRAREALAPDPAQDPLEAVLLDHVHGLIHSGRTAEIDGVVLSNLQVLRDGSVWTIHIWNQPYDSSWLEDRPAHLVRVTLCPAGYACNVVLNRP